MNKKILATALCFVLVISLSVPIFAQDELLEKKRQMLARGLSEANIETLIRLSFTPDDILAMSISDYKNILKQHFGNPNFRPANRASTVYVTGIPDEYYGNSSYFLVNCGFFNGDFYANNSGSVYKSYIDKFANHVFSGKYAAKYYFLYGELDPALGYHNGVDLQSAHGTPIKSAHTGEVVAIHSAYGAVQIYDGVYTHSYFHMSDFIKSGNVSLTTTIGYQSNQSPYNIGAHLHYENRTGKIRDIHGNTASPLNNIPYYQMQKNL